MAVDGSLNFNTKIDSKGFNRGTTALGKSLNLLKGKMSGVFNPFSKDAVSAQNSISGLRSSFMSFAKVAVGAFAGAKIFSFGKDAIESASDLAEAQNVVDVSFGKSTEKMEKFAETCVETYGISKLTAKQTGSVFAAMGSGMGLSEDASTDMAVALTGLSADMASFYNVEQDIASIALKSIYTGETETLKQFGIVMTEANLEAYALSQGIQTSYKEMSQAEKVQLRYNYVMQQTSLAQGDFARTSNGWANQTRMLSEKWKEFSTVIGGVLMNVLLPAVRTLNGAMSQLIKVAQNAADALASVFGIEMQSSSGAGAVASSTAEVADSSSEAADNYSDMAINAKKAEKANKGSLASFDKLNTLSKSSSDENSTSGSSALPVTGSSKAPAVDTSKIESSMNKLKGLFSDLFKPFADSWAKNGPAVISSIKRAFGEIGGLAKDIGKSLKDVWTNGSGEELLNNIFGLLTRINLIIGDIAKAFRDAWNDDGRGTKYIQSCFDRWNAILSVINLVADTFREAWNDGTGEVIFANILDTLTNINEGTVNLCNNFKEAWNTNNNGLTIMQSFLGIIKDSTSHIKNMSKDWRDFTAQLDLKPLLGSIANVSVKFRELFDTIGQIAEDTFGDLVLPTYKIAIEDRLPDDIATISSALNAINAILTPIKNSLSYVYQKAVMPIIKLVRDVLAVVMEKVRSIFDMIASKVMAHAPQIQNIIKTIADYIGIVVKTLKTYLMPAIEFVLNIVKNSISFVIDLIMAIVDAISGIIDFVKNVFSGQWGEAWESLKSIFSAVFIEPFKALWDFVKGLFSSVCTYIVDRFSGAWNIIKSVWSKVKEFFSNIWNGIKGVFSGVVNFYKTIFTNAFNAIKTVFSTIKEFFSNIWSGIKTVFSNVGTWFMEKFTAAINGIKNVFGAIGEWFSNRWSDIKNVFSGIGTWFKNIFSGAWNGIKEIWSKVANWFSDHVTKPIKSAFSKMWSGIKDIINAILGGVESFINFFISGINLLIKGLNKVSFDVPDWVPVIGGKKFGFNLKTLEEVELPRLATGTVVPANFGEFTAVLGDNKREPEVVSPVSTIKQALLEALKESGVGNGSTNIVIEASGNESEIIKYLTFKIKREEKRQGTNNGNLVIV